VRGRSAPPPRTKWTRRVPHPVLIGHAASLQERSREADVEYMGDSPIEHRVSFLLQADAANKCYRVLRQRLPAAV
jgi:hypothetical protein